MFISRSTNNYVLDLIPSLKLIATEANGEFIDGFNKFPLLSAPRQNIRLHAVKAKIISGVLSRILMTSLPRARRVPRIGNTGKYEKARATDKPKIGTSINNRTTRNEHILLAIFSLEEACRQCSRTFGNFHAIGFKV